VCSVTWKHDFPVRCEGCGQPYRPRQMVRGWAAEAHAHYVRCQPCGHVWVGHAPVVEVPAPCPDPTCPAKVPTR
jgi:hypothetical protein